MELKFKHTNSTPILSVDSSPFRVSFYDAGAFRIGEFYEEDGVLKFKGKADESADIFIKHILQKVNASK